MEPGGVTEEQGGAGHDPKPGAMGGWLLAAAAGALWAGIVLAGTAGAGVSASDSAVHLGTGTIVLGASAWLARRPAGSHGTTPRMMLLAGFLLVGSGWGALRAARLESSPILEFAGRSVTVEGTLSAEPRDGAFGWTASIAVRSVLPRAQTTTALAGGFEVREGLWLEGHGGPPDLVVGDRLSVEGRIARPEDPFATHLRRRGLTAAIRVSGLQVRGPPANPLLRLADTIRSALRGSAGRVLPQAEAGLLLGLAIGDTSRADPDVTEDFRATGLSHLTAVSGANVAMFLAPVMGLAMWMRLGPGIRLVVGLGAVGFFVLLTRAEPSVLRAGFMTGLSMLGLFLGRPRSPPAVMGAAVLILLGLDPWLVYSIGFQLSVAATAGMALLAAPLARRVSFLPTPIAIAAGATLGAQVAVTPLLLYHFGVVPTVTLPANLLAFPAVGVAMLLGLLAAGVGIVASELAAPIGLLARIPIGYLVLLADRMARSPLPSVTAPGGRPVELAVGFGMVCVATWWIRSGRRVPRRVIVSATVALPVLVWLAGLRAGPPGGLTVTFLDVGQGDAAVVRSPGGAVVLIDAGPEPDQVATDLSALGIGRLDLLVATHPHADHVAGFPAVLARFPVSLVVDPGCEGESPFYEAFQRSVDAAGVAYTHPSGGTALTVGDLRVEVLGPDACFTGTDSDANNDSLVLRISRGGDSVLFPGDSEEPAQTELLQVRPNSLVADVLKVPHHGGATSLEEFFAATHASAAVVSAGQPNPYGHPTPSVLADLRAAGMRVLRTDRLGDITVSFLRGEVLIESGNG
jgi:competence protein ComEC